MDWFQKCVGVMNEAGLPTRWESPSGLPVIQRNMESEGRQARIYYRGRLMKPRLREEKRTLDKAAQLRGIVANWVHSHDAAHLIQVANESRNEGIFALCTIHDSFGTHACDTAKLARILRETFIAMYEQNRLASFRLGVDERIEGRW